MEIMDALPKEIQSRDSHTVYRPIEVIKKLIDENGEPEYILVRDATEKNYFGSVKNMVNNVNTLYSSK